MHMPSKIQNISKHNFTIVTVIPNQTTYNLIPPTYMQKVEHTSHIKTTFFFTHIILFIVF
jgi:hypothetical protein